MIRKYSTKANYFTKFLLRMNWVFTDYVFDITWNKAYMFIVDVHKTLKEPYVKLLENSMHNMGELFT